MSLFRRPKHAKHPSRRREVLAALGGLTAGAVVMAGIGVGAATNSGTTLSLTNGQGGTVTCSDGSPLLLQPVDSSTARGSCFNPFAPPYTTTTTTQPPATTTTTAPPTTTTTAPPTTTTTTQPPAPSGLSLGSYNGGGNVSGAQGFASETGTTATNYDDYLDGTSFSSMCSGTQPYPLGNITGKLGSMRLILSVPLAGASYGVNGAQTLAAYAANPSQWEQCFTQLGADLVNDGFSNAVIRLMWEPDSGIYSNEDLTSARNFATLWRDAWDSAMAVPGAHFAWAWYYGGNFDNTTNTTAWPGSQYVTYVTFDQYDQSWDGSCGISWGSTWTAAQSQCVWNGDIALHLLALLNFANAQGKPVGIGEWGVINRGDGHGGLDDPTFIDNMSAWLKAHAQWASYFNFNSGGDSILSDFPNSLNAFKADL